MRYILHFLPYCFASVGLLATWSSHADSATLTITGHVQPGTCTLTAAAVSLPPLRVDQLTHGDNALTSGTIELTGCVGVRNAELSFDGVVEPGNAEVWKNTADTGAAEGVAVSLLSGEKGAAYLKKGDKVPIAVTGATSRLSVRAGYHLTAADPVAVVSGAIRSEILITANYL